MSGSVILGGTLVAGKGQPSLVSSLLTEDDVIS